MKKLFKTLNIAIATGLTPAIAHAQNFSYGAAAGQAQSTGMTRFIESFGGTFLLLMIAGGVVGFAWIGVELMFFDKEIRDVKKGLIGAAIMVAGPAVIMAGVNIVR